MNKATEERIRLQINNARAELERVVKDNMHHITSDVDIFNTALLFSLLAVHDPARRKVDLHNLKVTSVSVADKKETPCRGSMHVQIEYVYNDHVLQGKVNECFVFNRAEKLNVWHIVVEQAIKGVIYDLLMLIENPVPEYVQNEREIAQESLARLQPAKPFQFRPQPGGGLTRK